MSETEFGDYIVLNTSMIVSLAHALIAAGALDPSDIAAANRTTTENMSPGDRVRTELLAFAERWEEAEASAERSLAPGWMPEVVRGGKDGGNTSN